MGTDGRLLVPAPLRGTREVLVHQNLMADQAGHERIRDDAHLRSLYATHQLVAFAPDPSLRINPELAYLRRLARPWTVRFVADTARAFYERFHEPLQVNSACTHGGIPAAAAAIQWECCRGGRRSCLAAPYRASDRFRQAQYEPW